MLDDTKLSKATISSSEQLADLCIEKSNNDSEAFSNMFSDPRAPNYGRRVRAAHVKPIVGLPDRDSERGFNHE